MAKNSAVMFLSRLSSVCTTLMGIHPVPAYRQQIFVFLVSSMTMLAVLLEERLPAGCFAYVDRQRIGWRQQVA